jgi:mono/diheme cytochrome c family protein
MRPLFPVALFIAMFLSTSAGHAQTGEWPGLYFERCGKCHGNADAILDKHIEPGDGKLFSRRSRQDLRIVLGNHFTPLDRSEVEAIYMEVLRVAQGSGRFKQQCAICHISAEQLAREYLVLRDGELFGRYSGRSIERFLTGHGRLETRDDVAFFVEVLQRNLPSGR